MWELGHAASRWGGRWFSVAGVCVRKLNASSILKSCDVFMVSVKKNNQEIPSAIFCEHLKLRHRLGVSELALHSKFTKRPERQVRFHPSALGRHVHNVRVHLAACEHKLGLRTISIVEK